MAGQLIEVFYIGPKAKKVDNISSMRLRKNNVWEGFGTSLKLPEETAEELFRYPTVWGKAADVEKAKAARKVKETAAEKAARDKVRRTVRPAEPDDDRVVEADDADQPGKSAQDSDSDEVDRDKLIEGAILSLDPSDEKDTTKAGTPRLNRITEIVGTNVTSEEVDHAIKRLRQSGKLKDPAK